MSKKLWLLRPRADLPTETNPWRPWDDKCFGFVIRSPTEAIARELAGSRCGAEGVKAWLDPMLSSCKPLVTRGETEIVIRDFYSP